MPIDFFGYDEVGRNNHGVELVDRSGLGLRMLQLFSPGVGVEDDTVPLSEPQVDYSLGIPRQDFPLGTTIFTPDFGAAGARWRWDGDVPWAVADDFWLALESGSFANPISSINNPSIAFNPFAPIAPFQPPFVPPDWFWAIGRKIEIEMDVTRSTGVTGTTASTDLELGGTIIAHVPWTNGTVLQRIRALVVMTAAQQVTVTLQTTFSAAPSGSPPVPPAATTACMLSDIAVSSLGIYHLGFVPGVTETASQAGLFKLINFKARVLAD